MTNISNGAVVYLSPTCVRYNSRRRVMRCTPMRSPLMILPSLSNASWPLPNENPLALLSRLGFHTPLSSSKPSPR